MLYILERHGNDPEEAIVRAVNDTWDNDSIPAIVGAAVARYTGSSGCRRCGEKGWSVGRGPTMTGTSGS